MKNINEELNYMKYLLSYQKGRLISEQVTTPPTQYNVTNLQNTPDNTDTQYMCSSNGEKLIDTIDNEVRGAGDIQRLVNEAFDLVSIPNGSDQDGDYTTQPQTLINEIQQLPTRNKTLIPPLANNYKTLSCHDSHMRHTRARNKAI